MSIYTYTKFNKKIKNSIYRLVLNYIIKFEHISKQEIHKFVYNLKQNNEKGFEHIIFKENYNYSKQVHELLTTMVQNLLIKEKNDGYEITNLGKEYFLKNK